MYNSLAVEGLSMRLGLNTLLFDAIFYFSLSGVEDD